jgi:acetyl-CoA C-acetyltransferase
MNRVAIVGIGQTKYRKTYADLTYTELVQLAVQRAFDDCNLTMQDIDAVVFSMAPDAMVGISHPERLCADIVGARGKPLMRVNTGGSTGIVAVITGFYHVASGLFDTVLVAGAERSDESGDIQIILNKIWDPLYERDLPLNAISMLAFSGVRYMHKYGATEEHMAIVSVEKHRNALNNPYAHIQKEVSIKDVLNSRYLCWPIKLLDACPSSSGACAVILCSEEKAKKATDTPAWIKGVGHRVETYWMGDRMGPSAIYDHADAHALSMAIHDAYGMAGITRPLKEIDVAELYAPFSNIELHAVEAAGFCEQGEAPELYEQEFFSMNGGLPVNPSGGVLCSNPIAVTAMVRVAEAALQVQNRAGARQVEGAQRALATGIGGDHECYGAVVVDRNK